MTIRIIPKKPQRGLLSITLQSREQRKLASFAETKQRLEETPHKPIGAVWGSTSPCNSACRRHALSTFRTFADNRINNK